jgi:hypothetical protein
MNRRLSIAVAASLAAGGFAYSSAWAEEKPAAPAASDTAADARVAAAAADAPTINFPAGIKMNDKPGEEDRRGVLNTLDGIAQAALTKDGFDDLVERLVDQDRNRIGKDGFTDKKFDQLNAKVEAIRDAWKTKYGDDFEIKNEALTKVVTATGEVEDGAVVASAWPLQAVSEAGDAAVTAASKQPAAAAADRNEDANLEKGRDVAVIAIPASHGLPTVNLSLIQELQGYRVDIPNNITGQQLHDSLLKHLTHVSDMQAQWPANEQDAQLLVAHHIALGVYGVDADASRAGADATPASETTRDAAKQDAAKDAAKDAND